MPFEASWVYCFLFSVSAGSVSATASTFLRGNHALAVAGKSPDDSTLSRWPYYHTSDDLHSLLVKTVGECKTGHATLKQSSSGLDIVSVRAHDTEEQPAGGRPLAVFVAGEHARELFAAESAVHFIRSLCGLEEKAVPANRAQKALAESDFVIIPSANPQGRRKVEAGSYCKRTNEHGVDLNRNYGGSHRDATQNVEAASAAKAGSDDDDLGAAAEDNPGPESFSEPETQDIRDLIGERMPRLFLSIHTGAHLLGMPYGYSGKAAPEKAEGMLSMLRRIKMNRCPDCPFGSLSKVIGYESKGCSMDYASEEAKIPYSFTWEIFADKGAGNSEADRREAEISTADADADDPSAKWTHMIDGFASVKFKVMDLHLNEKGDATKAGTVSDSSRLAQDEACFKRFNPHDESVFRSNIDNWSGAYFDLADDVATDDPHFAEATDADAAVTTTTTTTADPALSGDDMAWLKSMEKSMNGK